MQRKCQGQHREQHEEECKNRKAELDELHERDLLTQPESTYLGECPICFLPMPLDLELTILQNCCSKLICRGCIYANFMSNGTQNCLFCRTPASTSKEEAWKKNSKRSDAEDPVAIRQAGILKYYECDPYSAMHYWGWASELGDIDAHYRLGVLFREGYGYDKGIANGIPVEKNKNAAVYHLDMAAIGGHPHARYILGCIEKENGNMEIAVRHLIIGANLGCNDSMKALWKHYSDGNITKEDLDATLRTNKAAIDATKSAQRNAAEVAYRRLKPELRQNNWMMPDKPKYFWKDPKTRK